MSHSQDVQWITVSLFLITLMAGDTCQCFAYIQYNACVSDIIEWHTI